MRIYHSYDEVPQAPRVVVLGHFDGLHLGHQALIGEGRTLADRLNLPLMVATFYPQFQSLVTPEFKYIMDQDSKMRHLEEMHVDEVFSVPFSWSIAEMTPEDFVQSLLLTALHAQGIVVGFDYTFGHRAGGKAEDLMALAAPVPVKIVPAYTLNDVILSSTMIREALREGRIADAERFLGYSYELCGEVIHGLANGRRFLVPTANVSLPKDLLLPAPGVYAGRCILESEKTRTYDAVINIGTRPTVDDNPFEMVEAHLLNFDRDIYGEMLCVRDLYLMRGIVKFDSFEALKEAIMKDIDTAKEYFHQKA